MPRNMDHKPWLARKPKLLYETKKCVVEYNQYNFIIRTKLPDKDDKSYYKVTYITNKDNLLWELCDCRKFFKRDSIEAKEVMDLAKHIKF